MVDNIPESSWDSKEIKPVNPKGNQHWIFIQGWLIDLFRKDWCWSWSSDTLATWCEVPTQWKRPWCWERLRARGEGGDRGWDGWMASLTQWMASLALRVWPTLGDRKDREAWHAGIARKSINILRYANDTIHMAESEEELKSLLIKVKEDSEKAGLKFNVQ